LFRFSLLGCGLVPICSIRPFKENYIRAKYERREFMEGGAAASGSGTAAVGQREGYLTKQGAVVKNWKRRWFVLQGSVMAYYKRPRDETPAGEIFLGDEGTSADAANELMTVDGHHFVFEIRTPGRTFFASADSVRASCDWIQSIRQALRRYGHDAPAPPSAPPLCLEELRLDELAARAAPQLPLRRHRYNGRLFKDCFLAAELVDVRPHCSLLHRLLHR
jgi:hypothetical protein